MFILPVNRSFPVRHTAWVIYSLIFLNVLIFLATWGPITIGDIAQRFGFVPAHPTFGTAVTAMFLHAGLLHLLGNMIFLWMFGESVENALGHGQTLVCYLASGLVGTFLYYLANRHSTIPCIGASGAISGIVGMYIVLFPRAKMDLCFYIWRFPVGTVTTSALAAGVVWLGEQTILSVIAGVTARITGWSFGVAFLAHVGGLLAGALLGLTASRLGLAPAYCEMRARKMAPSMVCPGCQRCMPRREAGRYCCSGCRTRFRVDEEGNVAVRSLPKENAPRKVGTVSNCRRRSATGLVVPPGGAKPRPLPTAGATVSARRPGAWPERRHRAARSGRGRTASSGEHAG